VEGNLSKTKKRGGGGLLQEESEDSGKGGRTQLKGEEDFRE